MKVSVCVITYNHEDYIDECLNSILQQKTDFKYEIVVGEDGSKDDTRSRILKLQKKYTEKLLLLPDEGNLGMMPNFIRTLTSCSGEYIALCEGDDYWTDPYKLQKQVDFLEEHKDFSICFTNTSYLDTASGALKKVITADRDVLYINDLFYKNYIATQTVVYRAQDMVLPAGFDELQVGDWPLHVLMAQFGKIRHLDDHTAVYRVHQSNVWQKKDSLYKQEKMAEATEFLYQTLREPFKPLATKKLKASYYFLSSSYLKAGDKDKARFYYKKLSALPGSWWTKNMYVLAIKKILNS